LILLNRIWYTEYLFPFHLLKYLLLGFAKIGLNKIKFGRKVLAEKSGELVGEVHDWQEPGIKSERN
jgi:hypothetical protein